MNLRLVSSIKNIVVPAERRVRPVMYGLNRGILMNLSLRHDTQRTLGLYEREVAGFFRRRARTVRTGIDVGAGDGYYTLYFLTKSPARRVYAFEPSEEARARIAINLRANGIVEDGRLVLVQKAAGSGEAPQQTPLDALVDSLQMPCLVKIDVEGSEVEVLAGADRLLKAPDVAWLVETHSPILEDECVRTFARAGYTTMIVRQAWWRVVLPEERPLIHNRWLIAIKKRDR